MEWREWKGRKEKGRGGEESEGRRGKEGEGGREGKARWGCPLGYLRLTSCCLGIAGFTGHLCQHDVDECASTPCGNGAKCLDGPNSYSCVCTEGASGGVQAGGGGIRVLRAPGQPSEPAASPGYTGPHCEVDIDECEPDPCHYGTCKDGVAAFTCLCRPGYTGHHCEANINECHSQPCRHGGTCQDRDNSYLCICLPGTTGLGVPGLCLMGQGVGGLYMDGLRS